MLVLLLAFGCANEWQALDADGDGWTVGAGDCWDETALHGGLDGSEIHPEAPDVPYDGVDADCAGDDDFDHDGDGYVTSIWAEPVTEGIPSSLPGGDCWDDRDDIEQEFGALPGFPQLAAADVHPGAAEAWYDGIDANCDGSDDFDQDADGHASAFHRDGASTLGDDCFDAEGDAFENPKSFAPADVHPGAFDTCYDATDADCDGKSDLDCDHDGFLVDADCDDENAEKHPGAVEKWYDGIDQDCDGNDGDKDHDGFLGLDYTGSVKAPGIEEGDCSDDPDDAQVPLNGFPAVAAASVHPAAESDVFYDGIDANCDGQSDFDADGDLHDTNAYADASGKVGDDCNDGDFYVRPGVSETCVTTYDDDCDGDANLGAVDCEIHTYDADGDGYSASGAATQCSCRDTPWSGDDEGDCDDTDAAVYEGAPEIVGDEIDEDCNGKEDCYVDADGDSYRPDSIPTESLDLDCTDPGEGSALTLEGDCDDTLDAVNPAAAEICDNGIDDNCDNSTGSCALTSGVVPTDIDTVADASLLGDTGDGFGYAIAAGELDGDGTTDVVISANLASTVYGYLGPFSALDVATSGSEFQIASSESGFAESLAASADLDADGVNDVAIGNSFSGSTDAGAAFVFFGSLSGPYTEAVDDADVVFVGEDNADQLGVSLAVGDWNDDGTADLAIGALSQDTGATRGGALWVFFGPLSAADSLTGPDALREGVTTDNHATRSIASGDVNADGIDDIAIGVPGSDGGGGTNAGGAYVVLGPLTGDASFSTADYALYGDIASGAAGVAVALGDFEGSGYADVLVGAPVAGSAYRVTYADLSDTDLGNASGIIDGLASGPAAAVGSAGDFDNDGRADPFIGDPGSSHLAVFYAPPTGSVGIADADLVLEGTKGDDFGYAARSLDDASGIDDLVVGAPADASGAGKAWIVFGTGM